MKKYKAIHSVTNKIIATGTFTEISKTLHVSKQAVERAFKSKALCQKCRIEYYRNDIKEKKLSRRQQLIYAIKLLKRARLIIDEQNKTICEQLNEYSSIGIVEDIDRFIIKLKE